MIVPGLTVEVPHAARERFVAWINENRHIREDHGI
ncbi:MAG: hypothetical protein QOI81_1328 [Actinomycetota bacterium]|nr:hypothetical protein [Actinomycetota bacterium]